MHQNRGLCQTPTDVVKEVRPPKHTYVCSEERTVICYVVNGGERTVIRYVVNGGESPMDLCTATELQVSDCSHRQMRGQ